jgi:hypothetical protein
LAIQTGADFHLDDVAREVDTTNDDHHFAANDDHDVDNYYDDDGTNDHDDGTDLDNSRRTERGTDHCRSVAK